MPEVGNQRSIVAPCTAEPVSAATPGPVAGNGHARPERDHARVDGHHAPARRARRSRCGRGSRSRSPMTVIVLPAPGDDRTRSPVAGETAETCSALACTASACCWYGGDRGRVQPLLAREAREVGRALGVGLLELERRLCGLLREPLEVRAPSSSARGRGGSRCDCALRACSITIRSWSATRSSESRLSRASETDDAPSTTASGIGVALLVQKLQPAARARPASPRASGVPR